MKANFIGAVKAILAVLLFSSAAVKEQIPLTMKQLKPPADNGVLPPAKMQPGML